MNLSSDEEEDDGEEAAFGGGASDMESRLPSQMDLNTDDDRKTPELVSTILSRSLFILVVLHYIHLEHVNV